MSTEHIQFEATFLYGRKMSFANLTLIIFLGTISCYLWAGTAVSGGGGAFVCRDAQGNVRSAELLDLWETQYVYGDKVVESNEDVDVQIDRVLGNLEVYSPTFAAEIRNELSLQRELFESIAPDVAISAPKDALNVYGKRGCPLEGMMYYDVELKKIRYDKEIFSKLSSNTQVAAAYLHEAIYKILRQQPNGNTDSVGTRNIVGNLFSNFQFPPPIPPGEYMSRLLNQTLSPNQGKVSIIFRCKNSDGYNETIDFEFYFVEYKDRLYPDLIFKKLDGVELIHNSYITFINDNSYEDGFRLAAKHLWFSHRGYAVSKNMSYSPGVIRNFSFHKNLGIGEFELETMAREKAVRNFECKNFESQ